MINLNADIEESQKLEQSQKEEIIQAKEEFVEPQIEPKKSITLDNLLDNLSGSDDSWNYFSY